MTIDQFQKFRFLLPDEPVMIACNKNFMLKIQAGKPLDKIRDLRQVALSCDISAVDDNITGRYFNRPVVAVSI
jgi:hypothetical protein